MDHAIPHRRLVFEGCLIGFMVQSHITYSAHLGLSARYVCVGWRACGVTYAYDFPYATMDLAHNFLGWNLLC